MISCITPNAMIHLRLQPAMSLRPWTLFSQTSFDTQLLSRSTVFANDSTLLWTSGSKKHTYRGSYWLSCEHLSPSLWRQRSCPVEETIKNRQRPKISRSLCHPRTVISHFRFTSSPPETSCPTSSPTEVLRCVQNQSDRYSS